MTTAQFAENKTFIDALDQLIHLQRAICKDDEDEADRLRDAMETGWYTLSHEEKELYRQVSGDLEMLCGQEIFEANPFSPTDYERQIQQAFLSRNSVGLLALLRMKQSVVTKEKVAFARSRAYSWQGFINVAAVFLEIASRCSNMPDAYRIFALSDQYRAGKHSEARQVIETILDDASSSPEATLQAAGTLFQLRHDPDFGDVKVSLSKMRRAVERVLRNLPHGQNPMAEEFGYVLLGLALQASGRRSKAKEAYERASRVAPHDSAPLVLLGQLLYPNEADKAFGYYQQAALLNTNFPVAYIPAAMSAFNTQDYVECARLCRRCLEMVAVYPDDASLQPIAAAAYFYLGKSERLLGDEASGTVHLAEAVRLNPGEASMREEYAAVTQQEPPGSTTQASLFTNHVLSSQSLSDIVTFGLSRSMESNQSMHQWLSMAA